MKRFRRNSLSRITLLIIVVTITACNSDSSGAGTEVSPSTSFSYPVRVQTAAGEEIPNADVTIAVAKNAPLNEITDSAGFARIFVDVSHIGQPGKLTVEADGYGQYVRNIDLIEGTLPDVVQLKPVLPTPTPTVIPPTPEMVGLLTYHGRYVTAPDGASDPKQRLRGETRDLKDWEKFKLFCLDGGKIALFTYHGTYVTAMENQPGWNWEIVAQTQTLSDWEMFAVINVDTENELPCSAVLRLLQQGAVVIALRTYHNRYVTAMDNQAGWNWEIVAERDVAEGIEDWEKFTLVPLQ